MGKLNDENRFENGLPFDGSLCAAVNVSEVPVVVVQPLPDLYQESKVLSYEKG